MEKIAARTVDPLVRMRAEIIALRLDQVRRKSGTAVPVVIRQRRRHRRHRDLVQDRRRDYPPLAGLRLLERNLKIIVQHQVPQPRLGVKGALDIR